MNSRQLLPTNKTSSTGFIYKPGFIDEDSLETLKMAVDKELGLISNCFYITAESSESSFSSVKELMVALQESVVSLTAQLDAANSSIEDLTTRVEALENKP